MAKDVWPIHITDKATFGSAFSKNHGGGIGFHFIWTRETGLIKQAENPETFQHLQQDLGRNYYGASKNMNVNRSGFSCI